MNGSLTWNASRWTGRRRSTGSCDNEAEGGILTASSGRGAVIGEDLAVARDLAIAEWVDQNRELSGRQ